MTSGSRATVRQLAAEARLTVAEALERLQAEGFDVGHGSRHLTGTELRRARAALELDVRRRRAPDDRIPDLSDRDIELRLLRPLVVKGKVARNRTTASENVWGHGVPDHQKERARAIFDGFLRAGLLQEKASQGRQHVWVTAKGRARLRDLERGGTRT